MTKNYIQTRRQVLLVQMDLKSPSLCSYLWNHLTAFVESLSTINLPWKAVKKIRKASNIAITSASLEFLVPKYFENISKTSPLFIYIVCLCLYICICKLQSYPQFYNQQLNNIHNLGVTEVFDAPCPSPNPKSRPHLLIAKTTLTQNNRAPLFKYQYIYIY